ncbi:MAG: phosphodiester glycosidase family protein [Oscillospiraceae bacterium]|nr:phosphodiester glycosidase family protein [Oscillospiraceae bacterium]
MSKSDKTTERGQTARRTKKKKGSSARGFFRVLGRFFLLLLETLLLICLALYGIMYVLAKGPSETARDLFVTSVRETSAIKFLADIYFTPEEIAAIETVKETMEYEPTDTSLITISTDPASVENKTGWTDAHGVFHPDEDGDGIIIEPVKGKGYSGYMMVVTDPSRVILGSIPSSYGKRGYVLSEYVQHFEGVAGTNAGGFYDPGGMGDGSIPDSVVVVEGQIHYMEYGCGTEGGGGIAAIDGNHILHVAKSMTRQELIDNDIQYAVCYGPVLIVNGVSASPDSLNISLNPRTAIGQCSDGAMLFLVIDGRQVVSMGAQYQDLVEIMERYGAVNAVNLDGGSSSMLWFQDHYVNNSSSVVGVRDMPTSFVILKEGANHG